MRIFRLAVAVVALGLGGCASLGSGGLQSVTVRSFPDPAVITISLDGTPLQSGTTPATVTLVRGNSLLNRRQYDVTVTHPGAEPRSFKLTWAGGWNFGNLVIGPRFGMVCIDPATGMTWKIDTGSMASPLDGAIEVAADAAPAFTIMTADSVPLPMWKYAERIQ